jgi:hypothetical protein
MIICSGSSNRHVKSLANNIVKNAKHENASYIKTEGEKEGESVSGNEDDKAKAPKEGNETEDDGQEPATRKRLSKQDFIIKVV